MAVVVLWTTPDISKGLALLQIQDIDFNNEFRILILWTVNLLNSWLRNFKCLQLLKKSSDQDSNLARKNTNNCAMKATWNWKPFLASNVSSFYMSQTILGWSSFFGQTKNLCTFCATSMVFCYKNCSDLKVTQLFYNVLMKW